MSDIDIERLREAVGFYEPWVNNDSPELYQIVNAAEWLLDLADEGGELWMEKKCPHEMALNYGHDHLLDGHCDGGSRVRVWPKGDR